MGREAPYEHSRQTDHHPAEATRTSTEAVGCALEESGREAPFGHVSELHRKWPGPPARLPARADRGEPQAAAGGALFLGAAYASGRGADGVHRRGSHHSGVYTV